MHPTRSASQGHPSHAPLNIEVVRQRARHRLMGATVLVLLGVVGFSLLLDSEPRPLPVDIPIVIPVKSGPPTIPTRPPVPVPDNPGLTAAETLDPREELVNPASPAEGMSESATETSSASERPPLPAVATKTSPDKPLDSDANPSAQTKPSAPPTALTNDGARAQALLNARSAEDPTAAPPEQRIIVQVGAFAESARAHEVRWKLERAGLKTYTHIATTAEGQRIRVRLGPFATRAEAEKAADRVKALGLPFAILTL